MFPGVNELTNEMTLPQANVMRFFKMDKGGFLGRIKNIESLNTTLSLGCMFILPLNLMV